MVKVQKNGMVKTDLLYEVEKAINKAKSFFDAVYDSFSSEDEELGIGSNSDHVYDVFTDLGVKDSGDEANQEYQELGQDDNANKLDQNELIYAVFDDNPKSGTYYF